MDDDEGDSEDGGDWDVTRPQSISDSSTIVYVSEEEAALREVGVEHGSIEAVVSAIHAQHGYIW